MAECCKPDGSHICPDCGSPMELSGSGVGRDGKTAITVAMQCQGQCVQQNQQYKRLWDFVASKRGDEKPWDAIRWLAAEYLNCVIGSEKSSKRRERQEQLVNAVLSYAAHG